MTLATVLIVGGAILLCFVFDLVSSFCYGHRRKVVELPLEDMGRILNADVQATGQSSVLREPIIIAAATDNTDLDENDDHGESKPVMEYRHHPLICKSDVINTVQGLREQASAIVIAKDVDKGSDYHGESKISDSLTLPQAVDDTDDKEHKFQCPLCGNLQSSRLGVKPNGCAKKYNHLFHGILFCSFGIITPVFSLCSDLFGSLAQTLQEVSLLSHVVLFGH